MDSQRHSLPAASPPAENEASLHLLIHTGLLLASERNMETIVQTALDAARQVAGARFGVFFYDASGSDGGPLQLYKLSAEDPRILTGIAFAPVADLFSASLFADSAPRSGDITQNLRFGGNSPFSGTPLGHLAVRSYLAVPVCNPAGDHLGGMLFGHPDPGIFTALHETHVLTIAAQACAAMENARLSETLTQEIALADEARSLQREAAERLTSVFESTTDGVVLMDRNWCFTYLNRRANDIVARGRNIAGLHFQEVFPDAIGSTFERNYAIALNERRVVEFTDYYPRLDIWASCRVFPTTDGIAIFFQDVTQQRRAERAEADSAQRLRQALEAAQLGTWTWDRATDLLDLDERAAELFYAEPHVPIGRTALRQRIVALEDRAVTTDNLRESLENGGLYKAEYRVERPKDFRSDSSDVPGTRWIAASGLATFREGSKEIAGMIGTVQDITVRKTQEAALRQSEKLAATGRLAATIAHEINNPLEAVTNLIYLSKTDPGVPAPIQHLLDTADNELARVAQIAQQTLGFYRDTTRPTDIDLTALLQGVVSLFSRKMQYKKIECSLDLGPDLHIVGLQGEVRQVFSNLLVNAIDASSKGIIHVRARRRTHAGRPGVSVVIADQGAGIPSAVRNRLFSAFFTTKQSVGTGLGLWVTRGIVEKQGGTIRFRTSIVAPTGTVFCVFLPLESFDPDRFGSSQSRFIQ